jgi:hypothetical protein
VLQQTKPKISLSEVVASDLIDHEEGHFALDMDNQMNYSYVAELYLGNPPQKIKALFDTGSANAWIISQEAVDASKKSKWTSKDQFNPYDKKETTTATVPDEDDRQKAYITFGSGSLEGYFIKDHCTLGDPYDKD